MLAPAMREPPPLALAASFNLPAESRKFRGGVALCGFLESEIWHLLFSSLPSYGPARGLQIDGPWRGWPGLVKAFFAIFREANTRSMGALTAKKQEFLLKFWQNLSKIPKI